MEDTWNSGDPYEYFMGRWSSLVAEQFVDWLSPESKLKWLDVGCGSGALGEKILQQCNPASLSAIDQSAGFAKTAQKRFGDAAECFVGNAMNLPFKIEFLDMVVSGLVLNFIPRPDAAIEEMRRVTRKGGTVAVYVWDYCGVMEFLNTFWDAVSEIDSKGIKHHEAKRFPDSYEFILKDVFEQVGLSDIRIAPIEITTRFKDFDDYWKPFLGGQGPAPSYVTSLDLFQKKRLKELLKKTLPIEPDGSIKLKARAWAARGLV